MRTLYMILFFVITLSGCGNDNKPEKPDTDSLEHRQDTQKSDAPVQAYIINE